MDLRTYGQSPFTAAVLHGGPGATGEVAPLARELSAERGVLEPLQTADSVEGQVAELKRTLEEHGHLPVAVIGYSWGAWLGYLLAARYPSLVRKLILVSSGPFEEKYATQIMETRLHRLRPAEKKDVKLLMGNLDKPGALETLGRFFLQTDVYDPLPMMGEDVEVRPDIYNKVWPEAAALRKSGKLAEAGKGIQCPVVAIHGDHDPHPAEGVRKPLSATLKDFKFILLDKCGHIPWQERQARDEFLRILNRELGKDPAP
ncbi:MAG TPA: alpha/beta hydrolase [bacterium]|nr:alpha/beta hydrolase [bacterium]